MRKEKRKERRAQRSARRKKRRERRAERRAVRSAKNKAKRKAKRADKRAKKARLCKIAMDAISKLGLPAHQPLNLHCSGKSRKSRRPRKTSASDKRALAKIKALENRIAKKALRKQGSKKSGASKKARKALKKASKKSGKARKALKALKKASKKKKKATKQTI